MRLSRLLNPAFLWRRRSQIGPRLSGLPVQLLRRLGLPTSTNDRKLLALRDRHRGRRAFILGNGPSLRIADLHLLQNEITFASNKVYVAFDQTPWRPTYYSVTDWLVARNNAAVIDRLSGYKICLEDLKPFFKRADDFIWLHDLRRSELVVNPEDDSAIHMRAHFSDNALVGIDPGWTVIYFQLQLAYYMGITEVILIGMDFSFKLPQARVRTDLAGYETALESAGEVNHFHPDYRKPGEVWALPRMDCQEYVLRIAKARYERAGRRIVNASRQTRLSVFDRVDLDTLLGPSVQPQ